MPRILAIALLAITGCSPDRPSAGALDLLVRRPDVVLEQPGVLTPTPGAEWGPATGLGWARLEPGSRTTVPGGEGAYVETNQPRAGLYLLATEPEDRDLSLTVWRTRGPEDSPRSLTLRLNHAVVPLETGLSDEPATLRVRLPKTLWRRGKNLLELEVEPTATPGEGDREWDTLAVARVEYGETRLVELDPLRRSCRIPPSAGVRYLLETTGRATLELEGTAETTGVLTVEVATQAAQAPEPDEALETRTVEVSGGSGSGFRTTFALPATERLLAVTLGWRSSGRGRLALRSARVLEEVPAPRPPVVVISIDTLAARHLSLYGYARRTTPELEGLARDAVVFERCVANAPWTLPSYLSALTGLYPSAHLVQRLHENGRLDNHDYWKLSHNRWTLAEMLRARGYQTAASIDSAWLTPRFRIDQGFDIYDLGPSSHPFHETYYGIRFIADQFALYLDELRVPGEPFFAFLQALDTHGPYWYQEGFLGKWQDEVPEHPTMTRAGAAPQTFGAMPAWMAMTNCPPELRPDAQRWQVPPEMPLEEIIARYDETILKTDQEIGNVVNMLRERGLYDQAILVVTGDHGESFAHGSYSHGVLWEDVVHVPLLVKLPGNERGGTRVRQSVQLVDLYPTLAELTGAGAACAHVHGRSLLPLMRGAQTSPRPTYCEGGHIDQRMVEANGWKLIEERPGHQAGLEALITHRRVEESWVREHLPELHEAGMLTDEMRERIEADESFRPIFEELKRELEGPYYELYHLSDDPHEEHDLAAERPDKLAPLLELMREEQARGRAAQEDARLDGVPVRLSEDERAALGALGYAVD